MHQSFLPILTAVMTFIAAIFNITPAAVPAKGELPHESEPVQVEQRMHDRVDGVDGSVFYISRPRADALTPVYAADFGMSTDSEDNSEPLNGSRNRGKIYVGENCSAVTVEGNEWVRSRYSLLSPFLAFKNAEAYYSFIK